MDAYRFFLLLLSLLTCAASWGLEVKVSDSRANNFYMDALVWVLNKSGADYHLVHTEHSASSQVRKVTLLQNNEIDVMYAGTSNHLEKQLLPIRYPITRGLVGTRLLLINKQYQDEYSQINSLEDLKQYSGVLSFGWPEKEIFEAVGLKQIEQLYDDIFENINSGTRYYFSRGVLEIYSELLGREKDLPNLVVETEILLNYRSAVFFFVNSKNKELQHALNLGFEKGYADGSYQEFFYNHPTVKAAFKKADLKHRAIINIPNPFFPTLSNSIPKQYWH